MLDWHPSRVVKDARDSDNGRFRIVPQPGAKSAAVILLDFLRNDGDGDVWRRRFASPQEAQDFAAQVRPASRRKHA